MKFNESDRFLFDCHLHIMGDSVADQLKITDEWRSSHNIDTACVQSFASEGEDMTALNLVAMAYKSSDPLNVYAFAGFHYNLSNETSPDFDKQLSRFIEMGFDGIKRIDGLPWWRKLNNIPMDSPVYDNVYAYLETNQIPIFWHVGDPAEFWDEDGCPGWARNNGWTYYDGTYVNCEDLYQEMENVLARFPRLKIIFDHFYFMSEDLERLGDFMERHPHVYITPSPGCEMFFNFSNYPEKTRDFFIKYQNRMVFGTDAGYDDWYQTIEKKKEDARKLVVNVRRFFEGSETFLPDPEPGAMWNRGDKTITGIHLDSDVLRKLYRDNSMRFIAQRPKRIQYNKVFEYADELMTIYTKIKPNERVQKQIAECVEILKKNRDNLSIGV